ncbi:uncharacterized protein TNCV_1985051 [Trichonephila clavipes]|nr:uncharacterized protein TNCV_1985051 [Trichonephila clavipes]
MDFTEINSRGKRGELLERIDRQNSRFRTAKTTIIKFGLHASFVELESAKSAVNETPERSQARRRRQAEYLAFQRAAETPEQSQARRLQHATYMAFQRDTETIEAVESRKRAVAERAQQRRLIFTKNTRGVFDKAAFEYDETLDYESHKLMKIEAMNKECRFCGALKWKEESAGMCCLGGSSHNLNWRGQGRQCSYTTHPNHTQ